MLLTADGSRVGGGGDREGVDRLAGPTGRELDEAEDVRGCAGARLVARARAELHAPFEDFARGIGVALERGEAGGTYNVGGPDECPNIEVVRRILELTGAGEELIEHVTDRPGHDRRYSLASERIRRLGWEPRTGFAEGIERTVAWYRDN
ncbi:MAG: hypothetical protein KY463_14330, partial [Actinobacteria bacterium]|nr:hypothetical protein [Actinomycetota bacterium]